MTKEEIEIVAVEVTPELSNQLADFHKSFLDSLEGSDYKCWITRKELDDMVSISDSNSGSNVYLHFIPGNIGQSVRCGTSIDELTSITDIDSW